MPYHFPAKRRKHIVWKCILAKKETAVKGKRSDSGFIALFEILGVALKCVFFL